MLDEIAKVSYSSLQVQLTPDRQLRCRPHRGRSHLLQRRQHPTYSLHPLLLPLVHGAHWSKSAACALFTPVLHLRGSSQDGSSFPHHVSFACRAQLTSAPSMVSWTPTSTWSCASFAPTSTRPCRPAPLLTPPLACTASARLTLRALSRSSPASRCSSPLSPC